MNSPRILIVDDSSIDRMVLKRALISKGAEVIIEEVDSAIDAIFRFSEEEFDAVFVDVRMPGESGFSVLHNLRSRKISTWPLVFMMSSSQHPDDVREAYANRATAYLSKPNGVAELREVAGSCLSLICETARLTRVAAY